MYYQSYKKRPINVWKLIIKSISILFCLLIVLASGLMFYCNTMLEYYPVSQNSMQPLINPNGVDEDYVYISNDTQNLNYKDIIIYDHNGTLVIKRIIAKEGDKIMIKQIENGQYRFFIMYKDDTNWIQIEEDYIKNKNVYEYSYFEFYEENYNKQFYLDDQGNKYLLVEENQIFCAGDNRLNSNDCIDYGAQSVDDVVGNVVYIIHKNQFKIWQILMQFLGITQWK